MIMATYIFFELAERRPLYTSSSEDPQENNI